MKMVHPEIEAVAEVSKEQFNTVYAPRGWALLDPPTSYANDMLGRFVRDVDSLTKDEARGLIAQGGGDYPDADANEAEVKEIFSTMFASELRPVPATESPTGVPIKLYDPAEHPVHASSDGSDAGVLAYLEQADDNERQRVLELEEARGDQARVTVLNWSPPDETDDSTAPVDDEIKE